MLADFGIALHLDPHISLKTTHPHVEAWIHAEDGIIGGPVMCSAPRIMMIEPPYTLDDIGAGLTRIWNRSHLRFSATGQKHVAI